MGRNRCVLLRGSSRKPFFILPKVIAWEMCNFVEFLKKKGSHPYSFMTPGVSLPQSNRRRSRNEAGRIGKKGRKGEVKISIIFQFFRLNKSFSSYVCLSHHVLYNKFVTVGEVSSTCWLLSLTARSIFSSFLRWKGRKNRSSCQYHSSPCWLFRSILKVSGTQHSFKTAEATNTYT